MWSSLTGCSVILLTMWNAFLTSPDMQTFIWAVNINKFNEFWVEFIAFHVIVFLLTFILIKWMYDGLKK